MCHKHIRKITFKSFYSCLVFTFNCLQCFDAVGWVAGRVSGLQKTEWWGAGVVICLE